MTKDEVIHLSNLARISLSDTEVTEFQTEIDAILAYVGAIQGIASTGDSALIVPPVHNVLRTDEVTNEPGQYTDVLLDAAPQREGRFIAVKKILNQTN